VVGRNDGGTMTGMERQWRRRLAARRGPAVARWISVDARDVARIAPGSPAAALAVPSIARGVIRWRRRIEQRRLLAVLLRSALVGVASGCLLQLVALASGREGAGPWLVPAALVAGVGVALGLSRRTSDRIAARMLDRDLGLGAGVSTALELEQAGGAGVLRALALSDGRAALGRSLSGARVQLAPRRGELALLGALVVALLALVILPTGTASRSAPGAARPATHAATGSRAHGGQPQQAPIGPTLRDFSETPVHTPPLAQVASGSTRAGGAASGHSPYGGGIQNNSKAGAIQPVSHTVGPAGTKIDTRSTSASSGASEGGAAHGRGSVSQTGGTTGSASSKGAVAGLSPGAGGQPAQGSPAKSPGAARASSNGGAGRGGKGSSAAGTTPGAASRRGTPGGATAGTTRGARSAGAGIVPQLGAGTALPLQPGYEAVAGAPGTSRENASSSAGGGGGANHTGQASAGAASGGAGTGVPFVPPGGASVSASDRQLLLGYFGSFSRVTASGW
jgi:hypothetical protein